MIYDSAVLKIANGIGNTIHSDRGLSIFDYAQIGGCSPDELVSIKEAIERASDYDTLYEQAFSSETLLKIANGISNTIQSNKDLGILDYARIGGCSTDELDEIRRAMVHASFYLPSDGKQNFEALKQVLQLPKNVVVYTDGRYLSDLAIWGAGVFGELWDPYKKKYIHKDDLPAPLQKAYENLWESSGDDYLVEYSGKYYYMLDHAYHKESACDYGVQKMSELFDIALENAKTVAVNEALSDCLVLVSKSCRENGDVHFVSVLIDAEESRTKVDQIKNVLAECMFKNPEHAQKKSIVSQVKFASARVAASPCNFGEKNTISEREI